MLNLYDNNLVRLGSMEPLTALNEVRLYGNNLEEMPVFGRRDTLLASQLPPRLTSFVPLEP